MAQKRNVDVLTKSVLDVLTARKQRGLLPQVSAALKRIDSDQKNQNKGIVYAPILLDKQRLHRVKNVVQKLAQRDIELTTKLDRNMLGGFRVEVGDWVLDASLRSDFVRLIKTLSVND
ncbi:MAG: F0F1 ATP synthase subunit delta [Patescibacteria group bacterium]|nr:F0F1 ATP synthase subunit delta [Patescibacteria group bacterium]